MRLTKTTDKNKGRFKTMKNQKNIISLTVSELWQAFESESESLCEVAKKDSNKRKQINKCRFVQYLLDSMPENVVITVEGCWGDGVIRSGCLANAGSVVECVVKYHLTHTESILKVSSPVSRSGGRLLANMIREFPQISGWNC